MTNNTVLDVRPVLASGDEPFQLIMETANGITDGGTLELLAPFEPLPLYQVMAGRGFLVHGVAEKEEGWTVLFTRAEITGESTVAEVHERYPATAEVFGRHGMDLCCGGHLTLAHVAEAHSVDLQALLMELAASI